jgi:hypothetical protein
VLRGTSCVLGNVGNNHGKIGNQKNKSMILSPLHIGDVYTKGDKSDTIRSNKMDVNNKEMINDNHYQKSVTETTL